MTTKLKNTLVFIGTLGMLAGLAGMIFYVRATRVPSECVEVTTKNFQTEVADSKIPVFMEFYVTDDCEPCEKQAPIIEKLAREFKGRVKFVRIEASKQSAISKALGVEKVPTHVLLNPTTMEGLMRTKLVDEATLRKFIEDWLATQQAPPATQPATPPATQPATPPATQPATPPATQPATPPATQPATPPATQPATPPATQPATPPATQPATPPVKDKSKN